MKKLVFALMTITMVLLGTAALAESKFVQPPCPPALPEISSTLVMPRAASAKVAAKVRQVVAEVIRPGMSEYDKAIALHDWLVLNAEYDLNYKYYYEYGVLLKGRGVCNSYALAYDLLGKRAGLKCHYIRSKTHAWNVVRIDGKWYHLDCTWDDPVRSDGKFSGPRSGMEHHGYFGLPYAVMKAQTHHTRTGGGNVTANSVEHNYAYRNGLLDAEISRMRNSIQTSLDNGTRTFTANATAALLLDHVGNQSRQRYITSPEMGLVGYVLSKGEWSAAGEPIKIDMQQVRGSYSYKIVQKKVKATKLKLAAPASTLFVGEAIPVSASFTPTYTSNKKVSWKTSNKKVVSITINPDGGVTLTALKPGKATITATAADGSKKKASLKLVVN